MRENANLGGLMPRENDEACLNDAANATRIAVPSPRVRGEGCIVLQRSGLGEGDSRRPRSADGPPHPIRVRRTSGVALSPQAGRGHSNNGRARIAAPRNDDGESALTSQLGQIL